MSIANIAWEIRDDELESAQVDSRPAEVLQQELSSISKYRMKNNLLSYLLGLPGMILMAASSFIRPEVPNSYYLFFLTGNLLLCIGVVGALKFKGYHPAWGLLSFILVAGTIVKHDYKWVILGIAVLLGAVVLAIMKDKKAEQMNELKISLRSKGEIPVQ